MSVIRFGFFLLLLISQPIASQIEKPYHHSEWKKGIITDEFIYESASFPSVHAATIVDTPSGLLTAFFGGEYEGHPDVSIYISKKTNKGWTSPQKVVEGIVNDTLRKACYNPVLFQYPDGELLLFYKIGKRMYKTGAVI